VAQLGVQKVRERRILTRGDQDRNKKGAFLFAHKKGKMERFDVP